jgi:hypothetical protein
MGVENRMVMVFRNYRCISLLIIQKESSLSDAVNFKILNDVYLNQKVPFYHAPNSDRFDGWHVVMSFQN